MAFASTSKSSRSGRSSIYAGGAIVAKKKKADYLSQLSDAVSLANKNNIDTQQAQAPKPSFLETLGKIVGAPQNALYNLTEYNIQKQKALRGIAQDKNAPHYNNGVDAFLQGLTGKTSLSGEDVLKSVGAPEGPKVRIPYLNKDVSTRQLAGIGTDIVADPLNLVGVGEAAGAVKLGKIGEEAVTLNKIGSKALDLAIKDGAKSGIAEDAVRKSFVDMLKNSPETLAKYRDYGGLKIAGKTVLKGSTVGKGVDAVEKVPVVGKVVTAGKAVKGGLDDAADLFSKGYKAKRAGGNAEKIVNVLATHHAGINAAHDEGKAAEKAFTKLINKVKPKNLSTDEADRLIRLAREAPETYKPEPWMKEPLEKFGTAMDELAKMAEPQAKEKGIADFYRKNYLIHAFKNPDKAQTDEIISKFIKTNRLKNDPSFLKRRGSDSTLEEIAQFAKQKYGVDLQPVNAAEAMGIRTRMGLMAENNFNTTNKLKELGQATEEAPQATDFAHQAAIDLAQEKKAKVPPIENVRAQIKDTGRQLNFKENELERELTTTRDPEKIKQLQSERQDLRRNYASLKENERVQKRIARLEKSGTIDKQTAEANSKVIEQTNPDMIGYRSVPDIKELDGYKFPPVVADFIHKELTSVGKPTHPFLQAIDTAMGAWKGSVTTLFPAFHFRNKIGNSYNMWLGGFYNHPLEAGKIESKVAKEFVTHVKNPDAMEFVDKFGQKYTTADLRKLGIMGGQAEAEANIAQKGLNKLFAPGRLAGKYVEDPDRVAFFLQQRNLGKTADDAAAYVNKFLFNYGNQTSTVKNIGRAIPFFTWTANNIPLQVEQLLKHPGRFNKVAKFYQSSLDNETKNDLPGYVREGVYLDAGKTTDNKGDTVQSIIRNLGLPVEDLGRLDRGGFGRTFEREVLGAVASPVRAAAETATGRDFYRGDSTNNLKSQYAYSIRNYPDWIKKMVGYQESTDPKTGYVTRSVDVAKFKALDASGLSRALGDLFPSTAKQGGVQGIPQNLPSTIAKAVNPVSISDYNLTTEKNSREKEALAKIRQLLVDEGKLREYTNYYDPNATKKKKTKGTFVAVKGG